MKRIKKFLSALLICVLFVSGTAFTSWASLEDDMKNQVVNVYNAAKRAKGVSSFENICPSATGYQLIELGLITKGVSNDYPNYNADGKNWFPFYKERNGSVTSKGYRIICADGANCLQDLVNTYGTPLFNVVVSFGQGGEWRRPCNAYTCHYRG